MHANVSGVWKELPEAFEKASGTDKRILEGYEKVSGAWKRFYAFVSLTVSATNVNDSDSGTAASGSVSGSSFATPSGAVGTVTYLWEHVSTSSGNTPGISSATAQAPEFTATVSDGVNSVSTWKVTATDDVGSAEDTITVTLDWIEIPIVVTVSGDSALHAVANGNTARAGFRVDSDGNIYRRVGTAFTQIDTSTDWRRPVGSGAGFYVRFRVTGLGDPAPDVGTMNTWMQLNVDREFYYEESNNNSEDGGQVTIEISDQADGSPILDSAAYSSTARVGLPP